MTTKTTALVIPGDLITRFIRNATWQEVSHCLPQMTLEEFDLIQSGRAYIVGDSESGVRVEIVGREGR